MPQISSSTTPLHFAKTAIIGCGLMGGSFALAARQAGLTSYITGYSTRVATLDTARGYSIIDKAAYSAKDACMGADLIVLGVPVAAMADTLAAIAPQIRADALVIDLGSTKQSVVDAATAHLGDKLAQFVPCHPIAGKEKAGVAYSDPRLYQGKRLIMTPLAQNSIKRIQQARLLWERLGCEVVQMTALEHDAMFAAVSHLPHLLSFAMVNAIAGQSAGAGFLAMAGSGFRDSTRIAASDPTIWRDILVTNREQLHKQLAHLRQALDDFENNLHDAAIIEALITQASRTRQAMRFDAPYQKDEASS